MVDISQIPTQSILACLPEPGPDIVLGDYAILVHRLSINVPAGQGLALTLQPSPTIPQLSLTDAKIVGPNADSCTSPLLYSTPDEYDHPGSPLYWRRLLDPANSTYTEDFSEAYTNFENEVVQALQQGWITLAPPQDITDLVLSIDDFDTSATDGHPSNALQVTFKPTNTVPLSGQNLSVNIGDGTILSGSLNFELKENDVIEVRDYYPLSSSPASTSSPQYKTAFLGFVVKTKDTEKYGGQTTKTIVVWGTYKWLNLCRMISNLSVVKQFVQGIELNAQNAPSVFSDNFQNKTVRQIFDQVFLVVMGLIRRASSPDVESLIQQETLAIQSNTNSPGGMSELANLFSGPLAKMEQQLDEATNDAECEQQINRMLYMFDSRAYLQTTSIDNPATSPNIPSLPIGSFSISFWSLLTMALTRLNLAAGTTTIVNNFARGVYVPPKDPTELLTLAQVEHGEHQVYNSMISNGFSLFQTQTVSPDTVLADACSKAFFEFFEERSGKIVARPHRFNQLVDRKFRYSTFQNADIESIDSSLISSNPITNSAYVFNPFADWYIPSSAIVDNDREADDATIITRSDMKWMLPHLTAPDFLIGHYTDASLLLRYGMRSRGPEETPLAQNVKAATAFAVLSQYLKLVGSRVRIVNIWNVQRYEVPKLYYLEKYNEVGYLTSVKTHWLNGKVSFHSLRFDYIRKVYQKFVESPDELLNAYMCYTDNPIFGYSPSAQSNTLQALADAAKSAWSRFGVQVGGKVSIPLFRYLPNLLDILYITEQSQDMGQTQSSSDAVISSLTSTVSLPHTQLQEAFSLDGKSLAIYIPNQVASSLNATKSQMQTAANSLSATGATLNPYEVGNEDADLLDGNHSFWGEYVAILKYFPPETGLISPSVPLSFSQLQPTIINTNNLISSQFGFGGGICFNPSEQAWINTLSGAGGEGQTVMIAQTPFAKVPFNSPSAKDCAMKSVLIQRLTEMDYDLKLNYFPLTASGLALAKQSGIASNGVGDETGRIASEIYLSFSGFNGGSPTPTALTNTALLLSLTDLTFESQYLRLSMKSAVKGLQSFTLNSNSQILTLPVLNTNLVATIGQYFLSSGTYTIQIGSNVTITPQGTAKITTVDGAPIAPSLIIPIVNGAAPILARSQDQTKVGIVLLSPDFEFNLENLINGPNGDTNATGLLNGYLTQQDVQNTPRSTTSTSPSDVSHQKGMAIDLVPDAFLSSSGIPTIQFTPAFYALWWSKLQYYFPSNPVQIPAGAQLSINNQSVTVYHVEVSAMDISAAQNKIVPIATS